MTINRYTNLLCISITMESMKSKPSGTHKKKKNEQDSANKVEERMEGGIIVRRKEKRKMEIEKEDSENRKN